MFMSLFTSLVLIHLVFLDFSSCASVSGSFTYTTSDTVHHLLPEIVNLTVNINGTKFVPLQLKRVHTMGLHTPLYTLTRDKYFRLLRSSVSFKPNKNIGYYQDIKNLASFQIQRLNKSANRNLTFEMLRGEFEYAKQKYTLYRDNTIQYSKRTVHFHNDYRYPDGENFETFQKHQSRRRRREASGDYYIDITAMVDYKRWNMFLDEVKGSEFDAYRNVHEHYAYIFHRMNLPYQAITSTSFKLNIRLAKIIICENAEVSFFTGDLAKLASGHVDLRPASFLLIQFIEDHGWKHLAPFDHVMVFTG
ncbi:uncharacterized protein LOC131937700 [Physella acuta]|uniref:uncharacterized protein LOC131937700 n=1 Tax=Physella acuta TaxID=109671 RepID=UPI0027DAEF6E|nr:uncharacterized protein LOC131937700 [Physella acuta]